MFELNNFEKIRIGIASPEKIREWSHGEVTKPETINYRTQKPEKDGLFCEKIFGPKKDWECHCGKYKRIRYRGVVCDKCGVEVTRSKVRRERMGHIELACPVTHLWYFRSVPSRIGTLLDLTPKTLEQVVYYINYIVTDPKNTDLEYKQILNDKEYRDAVEKYGYNAFDAGMGAEAIKVLLSHVNLDKDSEELKEELKTAKGQRKIKAAKKLSGTLAKSAKKEVLQKTFTKAEMKEILAGKKANDNFSSINDNGIYKSKGKVVNGESVGVGRVSETFSAEPTGRYGVTRTNPFLRKGENPSKRPNQKQTNVEKSSEEIGAYKNVGEHHSLQQAAFREHPNYSAADALAVSEKWLSRFGNPKEVHNAVTREQRILQRELELSGRPNTMQEQVRIALQSMIKADIPESEARNITARAFWDLRAQGVKQPTNVPWSKKK